MYFSHILIPDCPHCLFFLFVNISGPQATRKERKCVKIKKSNSSREVIFTDTLCTKNKLVLFILLRVHFYLLFSTVQL